ncbi:nitroreductase family protein [bacterium]|nr:nitroreductase family protein [bacterium]RQV97493.1 MAG: NAD(P)H-dependent dehydrogenase/reductase [bacterium]
MVLSILQKRRSIRQFQNKEIEKKKLDQIIEALLRSPSSRSLNPWEFIVVTDRKLLAVLSEAKPHGSAFLKNAPLGIIVCADPKKSDVWIEDCAIASIIGQLTAESLGLGSCWIQIRDRWHAEGKPAEDYIKAYLDIPAHIKIESILAVGYADEKKRPHPAETLEYKKIHHNYYMITESPTED